MQNLENGNNDEERELVENLSFYEDLLEHAESQEFVFEDHKKFNNQLTSLHYFLNVKFYDRIKSFTEKKTKGKTKTKTTTHKPKTRKRNMILKII